ncbi:MAG TPA: hypothetical protein VFE12_14715 [Acetobacteraceae bacterium]|nr:hypothetical protein [Acetobacteraceae bacterium]
MTNRTALPAVAGLVIAPLAWAVNTQLGQLLPYADCGASLRWNLVCSALLLPVACIAGGMSWCATSRGGPTLRFIARVSGPMAPIFGLALLLQGLAGIILTGCER